ncbi:MAG: hypothetical protein KC583_05485 [Myxococcales bacterium]|nr:hypothetical protein [Myxococcales bacterium]
MQRSALGWRERLLRGRVPPAELRAALDAVALHDRDAWLDELLGLTGIPADGPALPRGCVPYLPSGVAALRALIDAAAIGPADVVVDVGAGVGRAVVALHLLTGAAAVGVEVQPALVAEAKTLAAGLGLEAVSWLEGDAADHTAALAVGTVFFLYCPFSGPRLAAWLDALEPAVRGRRVHLGALDLPLPPRAWLEEVPGGGDGLVVYRSRG